MPRPSSANFFVLETPYGLELWWDWDPILDGSPFDPLHAHVHAQVLTLTTIHGQTRQWRLEEDVVHDLAKHPCVVVVCDRSGVLSRRPLTLHISTQPAFPNEQMAL